MDLTWTIVPPPQYNNNRRAQYNNTWTIVPSRWTASRKPRADFCGALRWACSGVGQSVSGI